MSTTTAKLSEQVGALQTSAPNPQELQAHNDSLSAEIQTLKHQIAVLESTKPSTPRQVRRTSAGLQTATNKGASPPNSSDLCSDRHANVGRIPDRNQSADCNNGEGKPEEETRSLSTEINSVGDHTSRFMKDDALMSTTPLSPSKRGAPPSMTGAQKTPSKRVKTTPNPGSSYQPHQSLHLQRGNLSPVIEQGSSDDQLLPYLHEADKDNLSIPVHKQRGDHKIGANERHRYRPRSPSRVEETVTQRLSSVSSRAPPITKAYPMATPGQAVTMPPPPQPNAFSPFGQTVFISIEDDEEVEEVTASAREQDNCNQQPNVLPKLRQGPRRSSRAPSSIKVSSTSSASGMQSAAQRRKIERYATRIDWGETAIKCTYKKASQGQWGQLPPEVEDELLISLATWASIKSDWYSVRKTVCANQFVNHRATHWSTDDKYDITYQEACQDCKRAKRVCVAVLADEKLVVLPSGDWAYNPDNPKYWRRED